MINTLSGSEGCFCNHILKAHVASFLSKPQNLKFNYGEYQEKMCNLGINIYTEGTYTYIIEQNITDSNVMFFLTNNIPLFRNISLNKSYFQTKEFSNFLYKYYQDDENRKSIIQANKFRERYQNNNDVFIHVRLGDVAHLNQGFDYYDKALSQIIFNSGYISSDNIDYIICQKLIKKYNLKIINYNEIETIMFGSTCKNIILTGGSFSYIIGLFGFFSKIYYLKGFNTWYPSELFKIDDWTEITT